LVDNSRFLSQWGREFDESLRLKNHDASSDIERNLSLLASLEVVVEIGACKRYDQRSPGVNAAESFD
jgi:hypothetical protein